ncbi:hypothetical protein ACFLVR_04260 [Chloroflexota bacterium]
MMFEIFWTDEAKTTYMSLKGNSGQDKRYKAVKKAIKLLSTNPRHPSLQTHQYHSLQGPNKEKVFEAYAEQKTPVAYRIFWYYGPDQKGEKGKRIPVITIMAITPHP